MWEGGWIEHMDLLIDDYVAKCIDGWVGGWMDR